MEIRDEHVLITGSNRGIGLALARSLASEGCHLHLLMRKSEPQLVPELKSLGALSVEIWEADLSSYEQIEAFWRNFAKKVTAPGLLVNNAGLLTGGLIENQDLNEIYMMIQVNLLATIHLTSRLLPLMLKRGKGKIVNNASVSGVMHLPCASTYAAAKSGVVAFTDSIKQELRGTGVSTLLLLTPGIKTRMFEEIPDRYGTHLDLQGMNAIEPSIWAEQVKEAVLQDVEVLKPSGWTGVAVKLSRHAPKLLEMAVRSRFKRH